MHGQMKEKWEQRIKNFTRLAEKTKATRKTCANDWKPRMQCVNRQRRGANRERRVYQDGVSEGRK